MIVKGKDLFSKAIFFILITKNLVIDQTVDCFDIQSFPIEIKNVDSK